MKPYLYSVKLLDADDATSSVEIKYACDEIIDGIELMGVDAGLDWIPGDSILTTFEGEVDDKFFFNCLLTLESTCEFRGRGFLEEEDLWEEGTNHKLIREANGKIRLETEESILDLIHFSSFLPVKYNLSNEEMQSMISNFEENEPDLFQLLVILPSWIKPILEHPLLNKEYERLSTIIRYLKNQTRTYKSLIVDDLVRPAYSALTRIYIAISSFSDEDIEKLSKELAEENYMSLFSSLPTTIKELNFDDIGSKEDQNKRFRNQLQYI